MTECFTSQLNASVIFVAVLLPAVTSASCGRVTKRPIGSTGTSSWAFAGGAEKQTSCFLKMHYLFQSMKWLFI